MGKRAEKVLQVVLIILVLAVVTPVFVGDLYTTVCEDDFSYEGGGKIMAAKMESYVKASWDRMLLVYREQQGCYMAMFLDHLITPYVRWGLPGFHVVMILLTLFYVGGLRLLSRELVGRAGGQDGCVGGVSGFVSFEFSADKWDAGGGAVFLVYLCYRICAGIFFCSLCHRAFDKGSQGGVGCCAGAVGCW